MKLTSFDFKSIGPSSLADRLAKTKDQKVLLTYEAGQYIENFYGLGLMMIGDIRYIDHRIGLYYGKKGYEIFLRRIAI